MDMRLDDVIMCAFGMTCIGGFYLMMRSDNGVSCLKDSLDIIAYTKDAQDQTLTVLGASEQEMIRLLRSAADSLRRANNPDAADLLASGFSDWIEKRNRSVHNLNQTFLQNYQLTLNLFGKVKSQAAEGMICSAASLLSKRL